MPGHAGGGHSGGGHMGGGHSGGGHMGGGHSSFGGSHSSHSSFGGGPRGGMGGGPRPGGPMGGGPRPGPRPFFGGPRYYGGYYGPGYRRRPGGFFRGFFIFMVLMICIPILIFGTIFHSIFNDDDYDYDYDYDYSYNNGEYTKLTPSEAYDTNNVIDYTGKVVDEAALSEDLEYVYDKTGIQPYILVVDNQNGSYDEDNYSNEYYDNNIDVENGFLVTYYYSDDSDSYDVYYTLGYDTEYFVDDDFIETFYANLDDSWNYNSDNQTNAFSNALTETVNSINIVDENNPSDESIDITPAEATEKKSFFAEHKKLLIGLGAGVAAIAAVLAINKNKKKKENQDAVDDMNQYYTDNSDDNDTYSSTQ